MTKLNDVIKSAEKQKAEDDSKVIVVFVVIVLIVAFRIKRKEICYKLKLKLLEMNWI